jgi:hypothetical protein
MNPNHAETPDRQAPENDSQAPGSRADRAELIASDARLQTLRNAADAWRSRGPAAGRAVLDVLGEITQTDQARFTPEEQSAYAALLRVKGHFAARDAGMSQATKGQVRILVEPAGGEQVGRVAQALSDNLRNAGFLLAKGPEDADLRVKVTVQGIGKLSEDLSSGWRTLVYSAQLSVSATWTADNSVLLSEQYAGQGRDRDEQQSKNAALRDAIDHFVQEFNGAVAK